MKVTTFPAGLSKIMSNVFGTLQWCEIDPLDPRGYNAGYQLTQMLPEDLEIINRLIEEYGRDNEKKTIDLRHSYKW